MLVRQAFANYSTVFGKYLVSVLDLAHTVAYRYGGSDLCKVQHFKLQTLTFPHISAVDRWNFLGCDNWTNCLVKQCKKQSSNPVFAIYSANQPWLPIWLIFYTVLYCTVKLNLSRFSSKKKDQVANQLLFSTGLSSPLQFPIIVTDNQICM